MNEEALHRIALLVNVEAERIQDLWSATSVNAFRSLQNFERWLSATSSPALQLEWILSEREGLKRFLDLLGASQPIADLLVQNPELVTLVTDEEELRKKVRRGTILQEGKLLLQSVSSYSHALDRLRFVKQRYTVSVVAKDLNNICSQTQIWRELSETADALVELSLDVVWQHFREGKNLPEECPMAVVGFGKLGGSELNYSSDIDLAYIIGDDLDEVAKRLMQRFAEVYGRALSDRTGRGSLYRVDMRLRPYGNAGALVPTIKAYEAYYLRYAEPWEVQALLKARVVAGPQHLSDRWEAMRETNCFKPQMGESMLDELLTMRKRIDEASEERDIKRGSGGIRDVEFLIQIKQLLHGLVYPELRIRATVEALKRLKPLQLLPIRVLDSLIERYTFLRKLEHRIQLSGDQQTHVLPSAPEALLEVARLMGFETGVGLENEVLSTRRTIELLYKTYVEGADDLTKVSPREQAIALVGNGITEWFDGFPLADEFYNALVENEGSSQRVKRILDTAPALISTLRQKIGLTEEILSGEIEEGEGLSDLVDAVPRDSSLELLANAFISARTKCCLKWALEEDFDLSEELTKLYDALLDQCASRIYAEIDILALGTYGRFELTPSSDCDLLLLTSDQDHQPEAEKEAQAFLAIAQRLRRLEVPISIDLRLRPDGGKGLLVRSYKGLKSYDLEGMELWERFALGQARLVKGDEKAQQTVASIAFGLPLSPERLEELLDMKKRIDTERVRPNHRRRDLKLGRGGLNDIDWLIHLYEMRFPVETNAGTQTRMTARLQQLASAGKFTALEVEELRVGQRHLMSLKIWLDLQGIEGGILPENPDKLDRLAVVTGDASGNELLMRHEAITKRVRELFEDGIKRLRSY